MQTSFMHPPFGFALFYLRSVAPAKDYVDKLTGQDHGAGHDRSDLLGRGAVRDHPGDHGRRSSSLFPQMVMVYKGEASTVDPTKIQIDLPTIDQGTPPALEMPRSRQGRAPARRATRGKSGDPLQDMLKQQEDDAATANKSLEDALKAK